MLIALVLSIVLVGSDGGPAICIYRNAVPCLIVNPDQVQSVFVHVMYAVAKPRLMNFGEAGKLVVNAPDESQADQGGVTPIYGILTHKGGFNIRPICDAGAWNLSFAGWEQSNSDSFVGSLFIAEGMRKGLSIRAAIADGNDFCKNFDVRGCGLAAISTTANHIHPCTGSRTALEGLTLDGDRHRHPRPGLRLTDFAGDPVGGSGGRQGNDHKDGAYEREHYPDKSNQIGAVCIMRCFFSSERGAPLSAQIGAVVGFGIVAGVLMIIGAFGAFLGRRPAIGAFNFMLGLGVYGLFGWWVTRCIG